MKFRLHHVSLDDGHVGRGRGETDGMNGYRKEPAGTARSEVPSEAECVVVPRLVRSAVAIAPTTGSTRAVHHLALRPSRSARQGSRGGRHRECGDQAESERIVGRETATSNHSRWVGEVYVVLAECCRGASRGYGAIGRPSEASPIADR